MTQEQKDLLLKDLCARLPYGVKVQVDNHCWVDFRKDIPVKLTLDNSYRILLGVTLGYVKPYLFPLSSMTEEQKKEFLSAAGYEIREEDCGRHTETYYYDLVGHERDLYPNTEAIDWCRKNHFDIYGLIPMDLAIDATNKNIY